MIFGILIKTKREYNKVMKLLDKEGYVWSAGDKLSNYKPSINLTDIEFNTENKEVVWGDAGKVFEEEAGMWNAQAELKIEELDNLPETIKRYKALLKLKQ